MYVSARCDYAVRAMLAVAADGEELVKASALAGAQDISVGKILRAMNGSLTTIRGLPADLATYRGVPAGLSGVWLAVHDAISEVVDQTSLADLIANRPGAEVAASPSRL